MSAQSIVLLSAEKGNCTSNSYGHVPPSEGMEEGEIHRQSVYKMLLSLFILKSSPVFYN